jgi:hypothetical protein
MEILAAVGLAGTVVQFVDFSVKICALIRELSGAAGAPKAILEAVENIERNVKTLEEFKNLNNELNNEETEHGATMKACIDKAEALWTYLDEFKIKTIQSPSSGRKLGWVERRLHQWKKLRLAFKTNSERQKLADFQGALNQILELVQLQSQLRLE